MSGWGLGWLATGANGSTGGKDAGDRKTVMAALAATFASRTTDEATPDLPATEGEQP